MATKQGDPLLYEKRDRAVPIMETLTVFNKRAVLSEVPDRFMKVFINDYNESESMYMNDDEYYVDYTNGFVYMSDNIPDGQTLTCSYYGMGSVKVPASRVYFHDRISDDIVSDLQEMIDFGKENVNAVAVIQQTFADAIAYMESAKSTFYLNTGGIIRGNVYVEGKIDVEELGTFQKDLSVLGSATIKTNLTIGNSLLKTSILTLYGDSNIDGSESITGNLSVAGTISGNNLSSNTLDVANLAILGSLLVTGQTTLNGTTNLKSSLIVDGGTNLKNGLSVTGTTRLNGVLNANSDVAVNGIMTLNNTLNAKTITSTSFSTQIANIATLNVSSISSVRDISLNGTLTFTKGLSSTNKILDLQQGYGLYSDNVSTLSNRSNNRLWLEAPNNGAMIVGGRQGTSFLDTFWVKSRNVLFNSDSKVDFRINGNVYADNFIAPKEIEKAPVKNGNIYSQLFTTADLSYDLSDIKYIDYGIPHVTHNSNKWVNYSSIIHKKKMKYITFVFVGWLEHISGTLTGDEAMYVAITRDSQNPGNHIKGAWKTIKQVGKNSKGDGQKIEISVWVNADMKLETLYTAIRLNSSNVQGVIRTNLIVHHN